MLAETSYMPFPSQEEKKSAWDAFTLFFLAILGLALFLRLFQLGEKPYHHDESLYATYSWNLYSGKGYQYFPMLHGPFLFHINTLIFFLFGVGDFTARLSVALFGAILVGLTYYLREQLGDKGVLAAATFLALSPVNLYFSRFLAHDMYVAVFTLLPVVFFLRYVKDPENRTFFYGLAISLAFFFTIKLTAYIHTFIFATFLIFYKWFTLSSSQTDNRQRVTDRDQKATGIVRVLLGEFKTFIKTSRFPLIIASFLFIGIYITLFTTFFTNPKGVWDSIFTTFSYWIEQNRIQRIKGAFTYYLPFLILYELPTVFVIMLGLFAKLSKTEYAKEVFIAVTFVAVVLAYLLTDNPLPKELLGLNMNSLTHMETFADPIYALYLVFLGGWGVFHFFRRGEIFTAFLLYWSCLALLIYAYAGEKIPWLTVHMVLPLSLLAGNFMGEFLNSLLFRRYLKPFLIGILVVIAFMLHTTIQANYYYNANPVERLVYTHTSPDVLRMVEKIEDVCFKTGKGKATPLAIQGIAVWPLSWYLRDYTSWYYPGDLRVAQDRPIVVFDWVLRDQYREQYKELLQNYFEIRVKLREWWIPSGNPTWRQLWNYFLHREVYSITGSEDVAFYVKKEFM
jgi:uncharacterized protein (TIGR03663 family)